MNVDKPPQIPNTLPRQRTAQQVLHLLFITSRPTSLMASVSGIDLGQNSTQLCA